MKTKVDRGNMVFLRPGTIFRDRPLPTTVPFHVINTAGYEEDMVLVVREASLFQMLTADGLHIDRTHGIYVCLSEVAAVEAAA